MTGIPLHIRSVGAAFGCVLILILVSQSTLCSAVVQEEQSLLPPVAADHSSLAGEIRKAIASHNLAAARQIADRLVTTDPQSFEGYFWQGFVDFQERDFQDAVRSLRRAEARETSSYALKLLGLSYYFLDQFRLFRKVMQQATQADPADFAPYYYLGRYYASTDAADFLKASPYFEEAIKRNPGHPESHFYLGYCEESERKLEEAERHYTRAIALAEEAGQKFAPPYQGMARLRLLESRPGEALPFAMKAVDVDPSDAIGHTVLARVYAELHRREEAASEWQRAAELDPNNPQPFYRLSRLYSELGQKEKADLALAKYNRLVSLYGAN